MEIALIKESYEDQWLSEGHYLLLQFREGYAPLRITGREWANLMPFSFGNLAALGNLAAGWNEVVNALNDHFLEPYRNELIYQTFWGINYPQVRVFVQYGPRDDIGSLLDQTRNITNDNVGYILGAESPIQGPYSKKSEIFTVNDLYPDFQLYNPTSDAIVNVTFGAQVMKYSYVPLNKEKDWPLVRRLVLGEQPARKYYVGRMDPQSVSIPQWLGSIIGRPLLDYTRKVMLGDG